MKAKLEFDLPEERDDLKDALDASKWRVVVSELDNWLRNEIKYNGRSELQSARDKLYELLQESELEI